MSDKDLQKGSSPRVRGAACCRFALGPDSGIIPARAGSRDGNPTPDLINRDHPRACGEQVGTDGELSLLLGSSPRVRGAVESWETAASESGIIPARAGSRRPSTRSKHPS